MFDAWIQGKGPERLPRAAWFSPGGFQAYEHFAALPAALEFNRSIGTKRITKRIHALNAQMREGLAKMKHVVVYTPGAQELMSGMICFDVKDLTQNQVVKQLLDKHRILASATPYNPSYARVSFGIPNTPEEVDKTLAAIHAMA